MRRKVAFVGLIVVLGFLLLIQLVPYGRSHRNSTTRVEPAWDSPETRALAARACFDCHSNETKWPWYSNVAPLSWLIQRDVDEGRQKVNYSEWNRPQKEARESAKSFEEGEMPPAMYLVLHPEARLAGRERTALDRGLLLTFGRGGEGRLDDDASYPRLRRPGGTAETLHGPRLTRLD